MKKLDEKQFAELCKAVSEMTWNNNHTSAKLEVAKFFLNLGYPFKYYIRVFEYCLWQHNADGSLFDDVASIRKRTGYQMMFYIKDILTASQFEKLERAF